MSKFKQGDIVRHRKGGDYRILITPDRCRIESTNMAAYVYSAVSNGSIWVRPHYEMEDGRFFYPPWERDNKATWSLLNLTDDGACVPEEAIASWTDEQCKQAEDWAAAVHLRASDNDDVEVPPIPEHVKQHATPEALRRVRETFL